MRILHARTVVVVMLCSSVVALYTSAYAQQPAKPGDSAVIREFEKRVGEYIKQRDKASPPSAPTSDVAKLKEQQKLAAEKVRDARSTAKQGDVFAAPAVANYFRHRIQSTMSRAEGHRVKTSLRHAEPVNGIHLEVNGEYPDGVPLQSTPPSLLLSLPRLPKGLEYRIVNSDLVLLDTSTSLIVDYLSGVIAPVEAK